MTTPEEVEEAVRYAVDVLNESSERCEREVAILSKLPPFIKAAMEWNRLRQEMTIFTAACNHIREWTDLTSRHLDAEREMRASYRAFMAPPEVKEP